MIKFFELIADVTVVFSVVLALAIILKFNYLSKPLRLVGVYLIVGASIEIVSSAFYNINEPNLIFFHLFSFFEIVILTHLFKIVFNTLKSKLNIYYWAVPTIILVILNTIFIQGIDQLNTYSSILVSIILIGYCIHYFILILDVKAPNYQFITLKWFIICLFIFHSISLVFMAFGSIIPDISREAQSYLWSFRSVILLTTKIILTFCFVNLFLKNSKLSAHE